MNKTTEKSISILRQKVKASDYQISKDGMFDPLCPFGYNYATGYTDDNRHRDTSAGLPHSVNGKINGVTIKN